MKNNQSKTVLKRVLSTSSVIGYFLLICTVGILCYFIISNKINNRVPVLGGYSFLKVITSSMEPELSVGEYILVKKIDVNNIKEEDIISYYYTLSNAQKNELGISQNKIVITHRVKEIVKDSDTNLIIKFITHGDANSADKTENVNPEQVIGIYDTSHPIIVKILSFFSNPIGIILLVIFPLSMILVSDIVSLVKVVKEKEDDNYYDDDDETMIDDDDDEFGSFDYGENESFDNYDYKSKYIDYYSDDD